MSSTTIKKFGTTPVFLTAISTILGAIMFLRFGYAVGNVGFIGTLGIIIIGHLVTIPTAMAIAEISTNQKVEGGGEYYIISRSFGRTIGATIGISLYLSQAISVAFYIVAMGVAFGPLLEWLELTYHFTVPDTRLITLPCLGLMTLLILTKGADLGMKALYVVVLILFISLILFFAGSGSPQGITFDTLTRTTSSPESFFLVFAICFPAFTGMTAGVGLSGDLKDPSVSIPKGTLYATLIGLIIYILIALKLATSTDTESLIENELVMSNIALWGPIIPIGLAAATFSSALGSYLVAPRTLQALGKDEVFPNIKMNEFLSKGKGKNNEPFSASLVTMLIAIIFVGIGDVNFVAEIISMFFMVTYGSLCLISFFQHFSGDPSYRPTFKSRWYISLFGAFMCFFMMFKMNTLYAVLALLLMVVLYYYLNSKNEGKKQGIAGIFQGVIFQFSRSIQVFLQKSEKDINDETWRPSVVAFSNQTFQQNASFQVMKWVTRKHGFGSYIHWVKANFDVNTANESEEILKRMIRISNVSHSNFYLDTLVAPSYTGSLVQILQMPGISGKDNNMVLLDFERGNQEQPAQIVENYNLMVTDNHDICILSTSSKGFGVMNEIHIWIDVDQINNAQMMIVLSYIILGNSDWKKGQAKVFVTIPEHDDGLMQRKFEDLIFSGRIPISNSNVVFINGDNRNVLIQEHSKDADLLMIGFNQKTCGNELLKNSEDFMSLSNVLYVNSNSEKKFGME